ncbi:MAG: amidohydrolase, partial [Chloroflexi bacterium]
MKILFNAHIHTFDRRQPKASAILINRDRIVSIGHGELLDSFPTINREDMDGRVILPGLTDAHIHLMHYALGLQKVDVETKTKAEALKRVAERAAKTAPGQWILGHGWQQNDWPPSSAGAPAGQFPTAADLDAIATDKPIYLTAKSLHAGWANTTALRIAGIGPGTPDPHNGKIVRDEHGQPNGILLETAMSLLEEKLPQPTVGEVAEAIAAAQPILFGMGLTGAHDFDYRPCFMALQQL